MNPVLDRRDAIDAFAAGLMVLLTLTWGLNQVAIKISNEGYNPVFLTVARSTIAAVSTKGCSKAILRGKCVSSCVISTGHQ